MVGRRVVSVALVLAVVTGACSVDDRDILATVDGEKITVEQFETVINTSRALTGLAVDPVRLDNAEAAAALTNLIQLAVVRQPFAEVGIELPPLSGTADENQSAVMGAAIDELGSILVADSVRLDQDAVQAWLDAMTPFDRPTCASHILLSDVEAAESVVDRLADGESFEALAAELSIDPGTVSSGGSLGCRPPAEYIPEFSAALVLLGVDEVSGPVLSSFGFHVIKRTPDTGDVTEGFLDDLRSTAVNEWFADVFETAEVDLDPAAGTWSGIRVLVPDSEPEPALGS